MLREFSPIHDVAITRSNVVRSGEITQAMVLNKALTVSIAAQHKSAGIGSETYSVKTSLRETLIGTVPNLRQRPKNEEYV